MILCYGNDTLDVHLHVGKEFSYLKEEFVVQLLNNCQRIRSYLKLLENYILDLESYFDFEMS